LPGIGAVDHLPMAKYLGVMMAHMASPEKLVMQAKLMEAYGANCRYITGSAGHTLPEDVKARIAAVQQVLPETELGFHGHHNHRDGHG
jgi:4-hydroxy-2-oxovalerate/4-hydroxy-2-oxohexanoate aldolase